MDPTEPLHGRCLCGAVRLVATPKSHEVDVCHCSLCRTWSGGPMFAVECADAVAFEGAEHIAVYPSSDWAERGFCRHCGTHLFYRLQAGTHYALPVGLLDDQDRWQLTRQIFIDDKPAFYSLAEDTTNLTAAEVFALYSSE
ncbi:GFA family protein [Spiribacter halobius]|uniref:Aldehyde-activating protein n=1 Tax=Sediminicurvatus halobius TaxID=2182432 RepID=A0A2U2N4A8_9GAMM|nr:GFA family protein [Spiribacter halobius]PWG63887.1 aldehyde-activating protein [Spiribacter halobius]UEX76297.1 GFA family protein [Spiribacter halobius]